MVHFHQSVDGNELSTKNFYLNSIALRRAFLRLKETHEPRNKTDQPMPSMIVMR